MANELIQSLTDSLDTCLVQVKDALPSDFNQARFLQNTIAVVKNQPDLLKYNKNELLTNSLRAAYLGLDFMNQEAWLVPYSGHIQFQLGYKGACKFVKKYSIRPLKDIYARVVRKGDEIDYGTTADGKPYLKWNPVPFNSEEPVGYFAVAEFQDGGIVYEVMTPKEVQKIRNVSRCGQKGPWVEWPEEMAKKTVLKRLCKNIGTDFDNINQKEAWDADNDAVFDKPEPSEVVDAFSEQPEEVKVEATVVEKGEQIALDIPDVPQFGKD